MTIQYTVYDSATGEILRTGSTLTLAQAQLQGSTPGTRVVTVGSDPETEVVEVVPIDATPGTLPRVPISVSGVQIGASKTNLIANGTDSVTISPIPVGATYHVTVPLNKGIATIPSGTINDGSLIITTTVAGIYGVTIKYGTNLDFVVSLNAS